MKEQEPTLMDWILQLPMFEWLGSFALNHYVQAAMVLVFFLLMAMVLDLVVVPFARRWSQKTETTFDDDLVRIVRQPFFVSIILVGLAAAFVVMELDTGVTTKTLAVLNTVAIFVWAVFLVRLLKMILAVFGDDDSRYQIVQEHTLPLLNNMTVLSVVGIATYFIFVAWSIDVTAWLASAGIIGIAISFAAKDTLANLFAGVFIVADAPYKLGDYIVLDTGERGMVTQIGIRSTRLLTRDDVEITVPNSVMGSAKITNEAGGPYEKFRIRVSVGVAYGSDIDEVRQVLVSVGVNCPKVCDDPAPRVRFRTFGDSGINLDLLCWVKEPRLRGQVLDLLNTEVYKQFQSAGIEIPFPKRDLYIKSQPDLG